MIVRVIAKYNLDFVTVETAGLTNMLSYQLNNTFDHAANVRKIAADYIINPIV